MQQLRQQRSERGPIITIGKNAGVEVGNHLVREGDLGLRPLAGPQGTSLDATFAWGRLREDMVRAAADLSVRARLWVVQPKALWLQILELDGSARMRKAARGAATRN